MLIMLSLREWNTPNFPHDVRYGSFLPANEVSISVYAFREIFKNIKITVRKKIRRAYEGRVSGKK